MYMAGYFTDYLNKGSYWKHFITWGFIFNILLEHNCWEIWGGVEQTNEEGNIVWFDIPWQIVGMAITATRLVSLTLLWVVVLFVTLALIQVLKLLFLIHSSGSFSIWVLRFLWETQMKLTDVADPMVNEKTADPMVSIELIFILFIFLVFV